MLSREKYVNHIDPNGNDGDRRDRPFLGRWHLEDPDALREATGWAHANTRRIDRVGQAIVAELIHAGRSRHTSYSRRKDWYAGATRYYLPREFGYRTMIEAVGRSHRPFRPYRPRQKEAERHSSTISANRHESRLPKPSKGEREIDGGRQSTATEDSMRTAGTADPAGRKRTSGRFPGKRLDQGRRRKCLHDRGGARERPR